MSAFDDLTLGMIPTAWKDGKVYSAIPTETNVDVLEPSRIAGTLSSGMTWDGNTLVSTGVDSGAYLELSRLGHIGFTYELTLTANLNGSAIQIYAEGNTNVVLQDGTNTYTFQHSGSGVGIIIRLRFANDQGATLSNISLNQITNGDVHFIRGTSGTRVYSSGLLQTITDTNAPRLDYTGGGSPSILIEPQRKNQFLYSNTSGSTQFNYNGGAGTLGFSSTLASPDGSTTNSMELNPDGTSSQFWAGMGGNRYDVLTDQTVYTASCFVNYDNYRYVQYGGIFGSQAAVFDLQQETVVSTDTNVISARVEPYYQNWKRIILTFTFNDTVGNGIGYIVLRAMSSSTSHIHSPSPTLPMHSYGWQIEQASYPSSYIETTGTAVTRSRDDFKRMGYNGFINVDEGTFYVESRVDEDFDGLGFLRLKDRTGRNLVEIYYQSSNLFVREKINNSFGAQTQLGATYANLKGQFFKLAVTYNSDGTRRIYVNGSQFFSGTDGGDFSNIYGLNQIQYEGGTGCVNLKSVLYFNRNLTDSELVSLTT